MIPIHHGLSEIAERYDAFVIDLWGVLHDGVRAFPEAVACLERLQARGKRVLILSNAPRRAESVAARNAELGIARELCDGVMSSGEATWRHLARRDDPWHRALGRRCHHLGQQLDDPPDRRAQKNEIDVPQPVRQLIVGNALVYDP